MRAAIHQPEFFPWYGFFSKMIHSDVFVLLDEVQFRSKYFQNRNRILTPNGVNMVTLPVHHRSSTKINEVKPVNFKKWSNNFLKTLYLSYRRADFFEEIYPEIEQLFVADITTLLDLNLSFIFWVREHLSIKTQLVLQSSLGTFSEKKTDLNIAICNSTEAEEYLSGEGARDYNDVKKFNEDGIKLLYLKPLDGEYTQLWTKKFVPRLSVLDLLFNLGKSTKKYLLENVRILNK